MLIEDYKPYIENMLRTEPWRGVEGEAATCCGSLKWDGTRFWLCSKCGRIGTSRFTMHHRAVHPGDVIIKMLTRVEACMRAV